MIDWWFRDHQFDSNVSGGFYSCTSCHSWSISSFFQFGKCQSVHWKAGDHNRAIPVCGFISLRAYYFQSETVIMHRVHLTKLVLGCISWLLFLSPLRAEDLTYFFPDQVEYDSKFQSPQEFFGFEIGERHLQHYELVAYLKHLSNSPRVKWVDYGKTHGNRPLCVLQISSAKNIKEIDSIRESHLSFVDPNSDADPKTVPAVIWMGYGVHGNEPSASNAAALLAYHLIAGKSKQHGRILSSCVILLDPCLNPDGFDRFANWANAHRGKIANSDPQHREHNEQNPTGRTNYYWFDLNRDWMPLQHPESQGRAKLFNDWHPNVVLDYHEMGANSSYFFQPGVPSRSNPWTPEGNLKLTRVFADYHAKALDKIGSLYFTKEKFDDFYIGKGSSYPDVRGSIGILFEQASARGQMQETTNGLLEFRSAIRNQITTSLSSLEATVAKRGKLNEYLREFYRESVRLAQKDPTKAFVFHAGSDHQRAQEFIGLLRQHSIQVYKLSESLAVGEQVFPADRSFVVPVDQREYRLLMAMVESRTEFQNTTFYDISAWSLPLAFGLKWAQVTESELAGGQQKPWGGEPIGDEAPHAVDLPVWSDSDYGYLVEWNTSHAPRTLHRLHSKKIVVKVATEGFETRSAQSESSANPIPYQAGTLLIPIGLQKDKAELIRMVLEEAVREDGVRVTAVATGLTTVGIDLGSDGFKRLNAPKVLLVVGSGTSDYEAGEIWHHFDERLQMPITMVDAFQLGSTKLSSYTHIITVSGSYSNVPASATEPLQNWLKGGGTWIATGTSVEWLNQRKIATLSVRKREEVPPVRLPYGQAADDSVEHALDGAIFNTMVDRTHPMAFGIERDELPVFRGHTVFLEPSKNPYSTPLIYKYINPLLSGYASSSNIGLIAGSAAVLVQNEGSGRVIVIADDPVFRGYWRGTQRLLENGVFFGDWISEPKLGE